MLSGPCALLVVGVSGILRVRVLLLCYCASVPLRYCATALLRYCATVQQVVRGRPVMPLCATHLPTIAAAGEQEAHVRLPGPESLYHYISESSPEL